MIILRQTKGSPLTIAELDGNFTDLDDRVDDLEEVQATARSIEEITQVGNSLVVQYNDSTQDGPFTFQISITFRGDWEASTVYIVNDLVRANGTIYLVAIAHTSDTTFDPGENNGSGGDYYIPFLSMPELVIPVGGGTDDVLAKASNADGDYLWLNNGVARGGTAQQVLAKLSSDDFDYGWTSVTASASLTVSDAELTISQAYAGIYLRCTNAAGCVITILHDDDLELDMGFEIHVRQCSGNSVSLVGGQTSSSGVIFNVPTGFEANTELEGAVFTAKKIGANEWDVFGLLAVSSLSDSA